VVAVPRLVPDRKWEEVRTMDVQKVLVDRFTAAIRKALPKTPLIGPKWFRFYPKGKPADFQFTGCGKLAKAAKKQPQNVATAILKHVRLGDLNADATLTDDARINVVFRDSPVGSGSPKGG
jgi:arginyl-tRNA synthetase